LAGVVQFVVGQGPPMHGPGIVVGMNGAVVANEMFG
jgi:hypothetical protein